MCVPSRIPLPVTILYVVTVTNLVILLNLTLVDANVRVLNRFNQTIVDQIMDLPAKFGAPVPDSGVWGHLIYANPRDACSEIKPPPNMTSNESGIPNKWIALVRRNNCNFDWKVIEAQKQGYVAVIVHNVGSDKLVPMKGSANASKVHIPSVFIGQQDASYLYEKCDGDIHYTIVIDNLTPIIDPNTAKLIFSIFGIVIGSCFLTMIVFAVVKWIRDYRRKTRSRLSKANLKQLPIQKFKKGDVYDICAICLDEYEDGEKLRILPCNHAYHVKCIDPWLLKNKKTCPICKRKVMPSRRHSDSESDSDEDSDVEGTSESEPLLSTANRFSTTRGNTFNNTGVPERLLQNYNFSSSDEEDASSTEDSLLPVTSRYQSSVEVHSEPDFRTAQAMRPPRRLGGLMTARYAMFNNSDENDANSPTASTNEKQAEPKVTHDTGLPSNKPETKPKEKRAWEYGLSPPKPDHFSIYDETKEEVAEEEEPVAIAMSPNTSQEEEGSTSAGKMKDANGTQPKNRVKKSSKSGEKFSGSDSSQNNELENGLAPETDGRKKARKQKSPGIMDERNVRPKSSQKKKGKRVSPTGGLITDSQGREDDGVTIGLSDNTRSTEERRGLHIQTDPNLEVQGAVGGMDEEPLLEEPAFGGIQEDEENLLEQPIVEVVTSGRRKNKKKPTKKKR